jgi:Predicted nucleoside-diphosphate sugar epimerases
VRGDIFKRLSWEVNVKASYRAPWWVIISDIALINAGMTLAYLIRYRLQWFRDVSYHHPLSSYIPFYILLTLIMVLTLHMEQVYRRWRGRSWLDHVYHIVNAAARATVVLFAATFFLDIFRPFQYSRALFLEAGIITAVLLSLGRIVQSYVQSRLFARGIGVSRVIIVGAGEAGRTVMRTIVARPELGYQIVGFVDDNPDKGSTDPGPSQSFGTSPEPAPVD